MPALLLAFACLAQLDVPRDAPTRDQVEQAHQMLRGEWEIVSYIDDGENIGTGLIRAKMARNGRIVVSDRAFRIVNPETNEARVTPFRIDPLAQPRRILLTNREDRTVEGIYRFEGDDLLVCVENFPDTGYPSTFDAPTGSNRRLIRMRMVNHSPAPIDAPAEIKIDPPVSPPTIPATPDQHAARATLTASRRPTETELTRVRQLFSGNWDIKSVQDDGENLGAELISRRFAENGRVRFGTRAFAIVDPKTEQRTITSYRVDPTKTPSEIDLTTQFDSQLKGIYQFDGDQLLLCVAKHEDTPRPATFDAPGGSGRMLVRLRLSKDDATPPPAQAQPDPEPKPRPAPKPDPAEEARQREARIRRMITGAWTMTDTRGTLTAVFQPDGLYVATRTWARGSRRLFGPSSDTSNGTWSYRNGVLFAYVATTTDPRVAGHQINSRVESIGEDSMVVVDPYGSVKTFRKLR